MTDNEKKVTPSAFQEYDSAVKGTTQFLGILPKRYVRSFHGMAHGLASLGSLFLGNYLYMSRVVVLHWQVRDNTLKITFFSLTILSASITICFFWDKVQSWQLSTTTLAEKGLVPQQMQNFNRGRGTLVLLNYSLFPLVVATAPITWLKSRAVSTALSIVVLLPSWTTFHLIRDYGRILFLVYGMYPALVAMVTLLAYSDLSALLQAYPYLMLHFENQAIFVISCIQFGFLWYYAYSRRLISKTAVQEFCKHYHPVLFFVYVGTGLLRTSEHGGWRNTTSLGRGKCIIDYELPWPIVCHSVLLSLFGFLFAFKILKTQWKSSSCSSSRTESAAPITFSSRSDEPERQQQRGRRHSFFDAEGLQTRRRSSALEQIAELDQVIAAISRKVD